MMKAQSQLAIVSRRFGCQAAKIRHRCACPAIFLLTCVLRTSATTETKRSRIDTQQMPTRSNQDMSTGIGSVFARRFTARHALLQLHRAAYKRAAA
jgi:hypothetical protein